VPAPAARPLQDYLAYLFDVDGTLVYQAHAIEGAARTLHALKAAGKHVLAVTNNTSLNREGLAARFREFGLPLTDGEVFSALSAAAQLIAEEQPGARVYVFGNPGLHDEVARKGLTVTTEPTADYLVVGNHRTVTYADLTGAMRALLGGARFIVLNLDRTFIGPDGGPIPGCGTFVAAFERATGRAPDVVVGKPSATLLHEAAASVDTRPADCLFVGDNPEADVAGAHAAGMAALLVLTGVAQHVDDRLPPPEHVLPSVADLAALF
jgi:HAD superfamily hydrolase (TIGR01450 family)